MSRFLRVLGVACVFAVQPGSAHAQLERFVESVRELTAAASQPQPAKSTAIRTAADHMVASLAEWDRRIEALEASIKTARDADKYQLHVQLGVSYRARGWTPNALDEFDAAAALRPSSSDLQVLRALTLERMGQLDDAKRAFRTAWTLDANNPVKAYYVLDRSGAPTEDERGRARSTLFDGYRRMRAAGNRPSAPPFTVLDAIPDTLTRTPAIGDDVTADAYYLLVSELFDDATKTLLAGRASGDSSATHFARAQDAEAHNNVANAKREYGAALRGTLTGRSAIFVGMARLSQVEGDLSEAIENFHWAIRFNPNDPIVHRELAGTYIAGGRTDDAFAELVAALLIDPLDAQVFADIGQLYLDTGRHADAVTALRRALELAPGRFEVRYALATALTRAGDSAEAAKEFEIFERQRREALERRRRDISNGTEREERNRGR